MSSYRAGQLLLGLSALAFVAFGAWMGLDPRGSLGTVDVTATSTAGIVELRAMYGGLQVGMGVFLGWCLATDRVREGVVAATSTIGGLGAVRALAWVVHRPDNDVLPALIALELSALLAGVAWLWWTRWD